MAEIAAGQKFVTVASTVDTTERKSASQNAKTAVHTIEDIKGAVLGTPDQINYAEVEISSAQILAIGSGYIELLPAPESGTYYDVNKMVFEKTFGTTAYTVSATDFWFVAGGGVNLGYFDIASLDTEANTVTVLTPGGPGELVDGFSTVTASVITGAVELGSYNDASPTDGDGTLLIKIWYTVRTFGSEL